MPGVSLTWVFRTPGVVPGGWSVPRYGGVTIIIVIISAIIPGERGLIVFGHDHVGHGSSHGKRVYIESVDHYVDDVVHHCLIMKEKHHDLPLFIVGHSMGGMIAIRTVLRYPHLFKGMVLNGPLIVPGPQVHTTIYYIIALYSTAPGGTSGPEINSCKNISLQDYPAGPELGYTRCSYRQA